MVFFSILVFIVSWEIFKALSTANIPSNFCKNSSFLNTKIAFLICFWDFIFSIKFIYSFEEISIKGLSSSLKGCLDIYQEDLNKDSFSIDLFKDIEIEVLPNNTANDLKEGTITNNTLNSS